MRDCMQIDVFVCRLHVDGKVFVRPLSSRIVIRELRTTSVIFDYVKM